MMRIVRTLRRDFLPAARSAFGVFIALWAVASFAVAATPEPAGAILGDAPVRFESQDIGDWQPRSVGPSAAQAPPTLTRAEVALLYYGVYLPTGSVPLIWTGSIASCQSLDTNTGLQQAVIDRVNYYRALSGLPGVALLSGAVHEKAQQAALMMSAQGALSHNPNWPWNCWTAAGAEGAANSNLALGVTGVDAVDFYMLEAGAGNGSVGHRRWILFPPRANMATGDIPASPPNQPANALFIYGATTTRPATPYGVAWPPAGFVPYQNLPASSNRWSFSFPGANFSTTTIGMVGPQGNVPVQQEFPQDGQGDNTIVFSPVGFSYGQPSGDTTYTITVSGMTGNGVPPSVQYTVTVFDPATVQLAGVMVSSSANPSNYGAIVTLTALVTGNDPTGTVDFRNGGASLAGCSAQALSPVNGGSAATCATAALLVGGHDVTAIYSGDGNNGGNTSGVWMQNVVEGSGGSGSSFSRIYVQKSYAAYYGRPADPAGQAYWATRMDAEGGSLDAIIAAFGASDEFNRRYGGLGMTALVTKIYQQALGRDPDQAGLDWYVAELVAGRRTLQTITLDVLNGATTPPDANVVANRLEVASYYTATVAAGCAYGTEQDGVNIIAGVTADPATVAAAKALINARCGI